MASRCLSRVVQPMLQLRSGRAPIAFYRRGAISSTVPRRTYAVKSPVDESIENIQELYVTARDEFEIATEETEKKTVYAADDRATAQEELAKLRTAYQTAVNGEGGAEIEKRIGTRLRELERAVEALEERALEE